ncbi:MAG: LysR family transcriptional regulator [Archangium sp.]|nr:LysR family transcriptional regulator [Archangium sp.]
MELKHLKSFHAVAELLHFRRAAQRVGITQPAISQHVARLEADLGVQLLERDRRKVRLTPAGQTLRDETRAALEQLERAQTLTRLVGGVREKTLKVGQLQYTSHAFLPGALSSLKAARPDVLVELLEIPPNEVVGAVRDRWVDIGFTFSPVQGADDLVTREVVKGRWVVWVPRGHPLAALEVVPVARLALEPLVLFERALNPQTYDFLMRLLTSGGHPVRVAHHVQQPHHGVPLVLQGLGCFVVGSYVIRDAPRGVVARPLGGFDNDLRVTAVWRPDGRTALLKPFLAGLPRVR